MKKMLAILLALLMMLSGMATAEETTDNNTNISHMLELCQRVDILLRSDRMVSDWVDGADTAITEEQKIVNRLRVGNRTVPSAVYYVTGETLLAGFIGDNPDYTDTPEQRGVLQQLPMRILMNQQEEYGKDMMNYMARATQYPKPADEPEMGMYVVLYADALPLMGVWTSDGVVNDISCFPVLSDRTGGVPIRRGSDRVVRDGADARHALHSGGFDGRDALRVLGRPVRRCGRTRAVRAAGGGGEFAG